MKRKKRMIPRSSLKESSAKTSGSGHSHWQRASQPLEHPKTRNALAQSRKGSDHKSSLLSSWLQIWWSSWSQPWGIPHWGAWSAGWSETLMLPRSNLRLTISVRSVASRKTFSSTPLKRASKGEGKSKKSQKLNTQLCTVTCMHEDVKGQTMGQDTPPKYCNHVVKMCARRDMDMYTLW